VTVGSCGGASMEELVFQLPEDVIVSGFDEGGILVPSAFYLQVSHVTRCQQ
jgi:hypothetical protein